MKRQVLVAIFAMAAVTVINISMTFSGKYSQMSAQADESRDQCLQECDKEYQDCVDQTADWLVTKYTGGCRGDRDACVEIAKRQCRSSMMQACVQGCNR